MRYVREALRAMRRGGGPGLAVGIRLSADETLPEGRHAPETAAILRTLAGEGLIDYASAVIGDSANYVGAAWIVPPPPVARDAMREPASTLRDGLGVPLIATSRIHEPAEAEALLAAGAADAVGMTRALIADPDLPRRSVTEGREDERILCTGCNQGCIGHYHLGLPISCLQNPRTGRERSLPGPVPQAGSRVLVVGGGPAGMAAAAAAGRRRRHRHARSRRQQRSAANSRSPAARPRIARRCGATRPTGADGSPPRASTCGSECGWMPALRSSTRPTA